MNKKFLMPCVILLVGICISAGSAEKIPYNKIFPSTSDLLQTKAEQLAIEYYNQYTARAFIDNDPFFNGIETDSGRYILNSNLIRFSHEKKEYYGWVVSFFDMERTVLRSLDRYIGTVVVDSPSGQILFFAECRSHDFGDDCLELGSFMGLEAHDINSINNVIEIIEPLIFPSDTFGVIVFPSEYDISKNEAEELAFNWIAQKESLSIEEAKDIYSAKSLLVQFPGIVSEHIWRVYFRKEDQAFHEYQIGVYASHGVVWFASKRDPELAREYSLHTNSFQYINNEYCYSKIIDVTTLPYGDWGGLIDCIFGMDNSENDYLVRVSYPDI